MASKLMIWHADFLLVQYLELSSIMIIVDIDLLNKVRDLKREAFESFWKD